LVPKLYEIKLPGFNEYNEKKLHTLWKEVLRRDSWWHFFYEGSYTLLRIGEISFNNGIENHLVAYDIPYEIKKGWWEDNIPITSKFQKEFMYIFHGYSELAMKNFGTTSNKMKPLLDRVLHCFMNNMSSQKRRKQGGVYWEPEMIATCAVERALTIGHILGRKS